MLVAPHPTGARTARAFIKTQCCLAAVSADLIDTAVLLASEVVTNAILHGRSDARLEIVAPPDKVHVEVGDDNSRHPARAAADAGALDGRGMAIVEALAAAWGICDAPFGKIVWFDVVPP